MVNRQRLRPPHQELDGRGIRTTRAASYRIVVLGAEDGCGTIQGMANEEDGDGNDL
jgi:hypothetical protein